MMKTISRNFFSLVSKCSIEVQAIFFMAKETFFCNIVSKAFFVYFFLDYWKQIRSLIVLLQAQFTRKMYLLAFKGDAPSSLDIRNMITMFKM